ncbi:MAG: GNAT family N-acetyltransferase, partial [bacterium]
MTSTDSHLLARLAEVEYVLFRDPAHSRATEFGTFVHHPNFPGRYDCNQLLDCRCPADRVPALVKELDGLYADLNLGFRKMSGHDEPTLAALTPMFEGERWKVNRSRMTIRSAPPVRAPNPAVRVRAVDPFDPDFEAVQERREDGSFDRGFLYHRSQTARIGGEWLLATLDGKSAGSTGWFVAGGIARFRFIGTLESARGRGVATTLIRHVADHPAVQAADHLCIHVGDDGPVRLYEDLGFRTVGRMWDAMRHAPGTAT